MVIYVFVLTKSLLLQYVFKIILCKIKFYDNFIKHVKLNK